MRVLAFACLFALTSAEVLKLGYGLGNGDLKFEFTGGSKTVTRDYTLSVPADAVFSGQTAITDWKLSLRLAVSASDCANCNNKVTITYELGNTAPTASSPKALDNQDVSPVQSSGVWANIPLPSSIPQSQAVTFRINITCSACQKSAELSRLEAIVRYVDEANPSAAVVFGAFTQDSDRNTDVFRGDVGSWGPVVTLNPQLSAASDYVILLQEIPTLSLGTGVVYYFARNQTAFAASIAAYDPSTLLCASSSNCSQLQVFAPAGNPQFFRTPAGGYTSGEFKSEAVKLGASATGTWYVAPFITKKGTGTNPAYQFAIGFNAVPAAAAGLVPSFVVVAVATLFAALRV